MSKKQSFIHPFRTWFDTLWAGTPNKVNGQFSYANFMQNETLLLQLFGKFEYSGLPEEWIPLRQWLMMETFIGGHYCITDTDIGVVPLRCGYFGINAWNYPTKCNISNPILGTFDRTIGKDCAFVYMKPGFGGFTDRISMFSYLLAECDSSISVNLINSKATAIGEAEDKTQSAEIKKMYDDIASGVPITITRKNTGANFWFMKPRENYIAGDIHDLKDSIRSEWLSLWDINNVDDKRERMITSEVEAQNGANEFNIKHIVQTVNECLDVANKLYGLNLGFRAVEPKKEEGAVEDDDPVQSAGTESENI